VLSRHRGGDDLLFYSFSNLGARWGWVVNATLRPLYLRARPDSRCIGGWVGSRALLDGAENLIPAGVQIRAFQSVASPYTDYAVPAHHVVFLGF